MFNSINGLHITFITTISVFFKEFVYFLYDYFEHFKIKDSSFILETNKYDDTIKNLNKDNESGESSNTENKPSEASGSGVQPESSASGGKSVAEDLRNYQWDSDSDFDPADYGFYGEHHGDPYNSELEAENDKAGINRALVENLPIFEENIQKTEDLESLKDLKKELNEVIDIYKSGTSPSAKQEIAQIEKKIEICDNRISHLEAESKSKGKGKGN